MVVRLHFFFFWHISLLPLHKVDLFFCVFPYRLVDLEIENQKKFIS